MERFQHGGDTYGLGDVVDFSASLNPLGMPDQVVRAIADRAREMEAYPDPHCRDLVAALAQAHGIPADQLVITAGATDAFERIVRLVRPRKALVCSPCYSGYLQALDSLDASVVYHDLSLCDSFDVTSRVLDSLEPDIDLAFICSPNNPTGRVVSRDLICQVASALERCSAGDRGLGRGAVLVVDECFLPFTDGLSATECLDQHPNMVVARAFTKTFAMAGLRLGYCVCSNPNLTEGLRAQGAPWVVSSPAQFAGVAALEVPGFLQETREYVAAERAFLQGELEKLGMRVVPSHANFILFQGPEGLRDELLERGFLIRPCDNFRGLDTSWYRIAVRTAEENRALIAALREVV